MALDFSQESFFDNHTHLILLDNGNATADEFAINYFHGGGPRKPASAKYVAKQGVVLSLVHHLSRFLDCEETLEAVVAARAEQCATEEGLRDYVRRLYADEHIIGTTLDSELPFGDPAVDIFPCDVYRLFQYEKPLFDLMASEDDYDTFLNKFLDTVKDARAQGFRGLKSHVAEKYSLALYEVSLEDARKAFKAAKTGDKQAEKDVYYAAFSELLVLAGEINMPVHFHTGTSGFSSHSNVYDCDPLLMIDYLKSGKYDKTKIVILHASWPLTRNAGLVCANFPNVFVDLAWTLPWQTLSGAHILEDILGQVPHNKLIIGTGQHKFGETAWLCSKNVKSSLAYVLGKFVQQDMISEAQAKESARMILSENAIRAYEEAV